MTRRVRRRRPDDQLAPNPFRISDAAHAKKIKEQAKISRFNMAQFDRQPEVVRRVEHAVGNIDIARRLVGQGIRSATEAEPVVRQMLEARWKTG